ncbi:hypothetical protein K456DRAFT_1732026 [Colletotrichum gloeosporioides 23]|nr:hypothetical protein K456DRAFT_1732026 [Colletotrichum gloeosporioides 23]
MSNATSSPNDLNIVAIIDNHRWKLLYIFITGCTLSVCVFGRSLYEQHKRKALSWDNVIGLSLIFAIVMQVLAITPVRAEIQLKMATALFVLSKSLSSTYVLLLLRRIVNQVVRPILTHFTIVVVAVAIIASALGVVAPLAGCIISETASEAFCHPMEPVFLAAIAFDIFKGIWTFAFSTIEHLLTHLFRNLNQEAPAPKKGERKRHAAKSNPSQTPASSMMPVCPPITKYGFPGGFGESFTLPFTPVNRPSAGLDVVEAQMSALETRQNLLRRQRLEQEELKALARQTDALLCKDLDDIQTSMPGWVPRVDYRALINSHYQYEERALQKKHEVEEREDARRFPLPPRLQPISEMSVHRPAFLKPTQPTMYRRHPLPNEPRSSRANAQLRLQPLVRGEAAHSRQFQHSTALHPVISNHNRLPPGLIPPVDAANYQGGVSQPSPCAIPGEERPAKRLLPDPGDATTGHATHGDKRPRQADGSSDAPIVIN